LDHLKDPPAYFHLDIWNPNNICIHKMKNFENMLLRVYEQWPCKN
jgi:hypothetical protein